MKILVFTYYNDSIHEGASYKEIGELTLQNKKDYCIKYGYDFLFYDKFDYNKTIRGFERIDIFLENIDKYDWIFYIEADALITNPNIKLEDLIDNNYDMIIARNDQNKKQIEINNGVILLKCTEWSRQFLKRIHIPMYHNHIWASQQGIIDLINSDSEILRHIKLVNFRFFNSLWHRAYQEYNWRWGDFIIHLAGCGNAYRKMVFEEIIPKIFSGKEFKIDSPKAQ